MTVRIIIGDALTELRKLPDESVHCCVSSPPYFWLRDYQIEPQVWGGDPDCAHDWQDATVIDRRHLPEDEPTPKQATNAGSHQRGVRPGAFCRCGAWRGSLGLEPTAELYVEHIVAVFAQVRRVMRGDGVLFLNVGDSYASSSTYNAPRSMHAAMGWKQPGRGPNASVYGTSGKGKSCSHIKPKDLIGIPWMLAFALRADGWWLRQDIIWSKPNPMPESVTNRCTKGHEYLFLLSKSSRYYFDAAAIAETSLRSGEIPGGSKKHTATAVNDMRIRQETRNKRSVWTIATTPFPGNHFATMPPALVEPCILAGCPPGGVVLDPFGGAGTTGLMADRLGRDATLIEINPTYAAMARRRIESDAGLFAQIGAAE